MMAKSDWMTNVIVTPNQMWPVILKSWPHATRISKLGKEPLDKESMLLDGSKLLPEMEESLESNEDGKAVVVIYPIICN
jgi:hypothetical protein